MKNKIILNVPSSDVFNYICSEFINEYEKRKKVKLEIKNIKPGLTYAKAIGRDKKTKTISMATVKLLKYKYPYEYSFEYESNTYYRVTEIKITPLNENKCELLIMNYQEKLKNGSKHKDYSFDNDEIDKMSIVQRLQYLSMERQVKKGRKSCSVKETKWFND